MPLACCHVCKNMVIMVRALPLVRRLRMMVSTTPLSPASILRLRMPSPPYRLGPKRRASGCDFGRCSLCCETLR